MIYATSPPMLYKSSSSSSTIGNLSPEPIKLLFIDC